MPANASFGREYDNQPKENMFRRKTILLVAAALSMMTAAYAASQVAPSGGDVTVTMPTESAAKAVIRAFNIMDDARLRYTCVIGALGGALISIAMFSTPKFRPMAAKFTVAAMGGSMATPAIMRLCNIPTEADLILGSSFVVAILSYSVIQVLAPLVPKALALMFRQKYMPSDDDEENQS